MISLDPIDSPINIKLNFTYQEIKGIEYIVTAGLLPTFLLKKIKLLKGLPKYAQYFNKLKIVNSKIEKNRYGFYFCFRKEQNR